MPSLRNRRDPLVPSNQPQCPYVNRELPRVNNTTPRDDYRNNKPHQLLSMSEEVTSTLQACCYVSFPHDAHHLCNLV